jgi:hypothetical protein
VAFGSRRISLAERSGSCFTLVVYLLCAGEDLPPSSDDVDEGYHGRSRPMRVGFPTRTHRRRWLRKTFSSRARGIFLS